MPAANSASHDTQLPRSTVLVVDDNPQNVELVQAYLESINCATEVANDGVQALEKAAQVNPDLIILDVMMPRMSGFEVCRRLKADPALRHVPVLMLTALNEFGDIERGVESGTDDFLSKPINKGDLLTQVKRLLRLRHSQAKGQMERSLGYMGDSDSNSA